MCEFTFSLLPIYERGRRIVQLILKVYNYTTTVDNILGKFIYQEITNTLTKKGETISGSSRYYIQLCHICEIFDEMMEQWSHISNNNL